MLDERTTYRTCPLCEAACGLELTLQGDRVIRTRGDRDDVFSRGFICPKGSTLGRLDTDPDLVRTPLIRSNGRFLAASWDEAFDLIAARLRPIIAEHGSDAVAVYLGNPNVHNMSGALYGRVLIRGLHSKNVYSASTVDQMPKHVSCGLMFGHPDLIPVPDLDRTGYLLILGANPLESNGSLATAPDWPGRLADIRQRTGKVVVIDPKRTKTAAAADEHHFIRPGTDPLALFALVHTLFAEDLVDLGPLDGLVAGLPEMEEAAQAFSPEAVAEACGIPAEELRRLARELAAAESAAVYGRIGTHAAAFGTLAAWLVDVLNVLTGNLDRPGGVMFPLAAHERPRRRKGFRRGRWRSRVHGHPEVRGELPVATLADEIVTPGDGRVRSLITIAGNPVVSTPASDRLDAALAQLEFMVSVDVYLNETTRHADVILPGTSPLRRPHYDFAFTQLAVRNFARYSRRVLPPLPDSCPEWQVLLRLAAVVAGHDAAADLEDFDDMVFATMVQSNVDDPRSPIHGRDPGEIVARTAGERGPERMLDLLLRTGPYGDGYGTHPAGLSLAGLQAATHGVDLGPLRPRFPAAIATASGVVELAPEELVADVARLRNSMASTNGQLLLVGRRHLRSNNSWMHNLDVLVKGKERCTLQINPADAARLGLEDGRPAMVTSDTGRVEVAVEVTDAMMPGVVSLPHGWGHDLPGIALSVASQRPGVNSNRLTPPTIDPLSGNAVLNGIPVDIAPA